MALVRDAIMASVRQFERGTTEPRRATIAVIRRALEAAGVIFIDGNGEGPGVRLKKPDKAFQDARPDRRLGLQSSPAQIDGTPGSADD